jgi:hypothetical protein
MFCQVSLDSLASLDNFYRKLEKGLGLQFQYAQTLLDSKNILNLLTFNLQKYIISFRLKKPSILAHVITFTKGTNYAFIKAYQ